MMKKALYSWMISLVMILAVFSLDVYADEDLPEAAAAATAIQEDDKSIEAENGTQPENDSEDPVVPVTDPVQEDDPEPVHVHEYEDVVTEPTCTEQGYTTHTCCCGDSYIDSYVEALGHESTDQVTEPTCTEQGYTTHTCSVCGDSYVDSYMEALGHSYSGKVTKAAACEAPGVMTYTCALCGDSYTEEIAATGHSWGSWTVVKAATNDTDGLEKRVCKNDSSHVETRVIPAKYPLIGSARKNEVGEYWEGRPGDQTTHEVETQRWYLHDKGWTVIHAVDDKVREMIAAAMEMICANDKIGYSQADRYSVLELGADIAYDYDMLSTACNADCSTAVAACIRYAGINVTPFETDTEKIILSETGKFSVRTATKYTTSPDYLCRGDILVTQKKGHTAVVLGNGTKVSNSGVSTPDPAITKQPQSQTLQVGDKAKLTISAEGTGLDYRWYRRTSSTGSWVLLSAARGKTSYSFTMASRHNGYQYRCIIIDAAGKRVASNIMKLTLKGSELEITSQPESVTAKLSAKATFRVEAKGATSYQWYFKTSASGTWKKVTLTGGNRATYTVTAASKRHGYVYRCKVSNSSGSIWSSEAKLTVVTARPVIKTQPTNKTVTAGKTVTFKLTASGRALNYQWYYRTSSTGSWKKVTAESAQTAACSFTAAAKQNGWQYKCIVKNLKGSVTSRIVKLTVR